MSHEEERRGTIPNPEELAGQELKRLRQVRGWSQEHVARRMAEYGYDWHQTTVGRTETATRPLRLNEAVALAGLFEVPVTQLVAPPKVAESAELAAQIQATEERLRAAQAARDAAADAAADAAERAKAASYHAAEAAAELSRCSGELDRLLAIRGTLTRERGR